MRSSHVIAIAALLLVAGSSPVLAGDLLSRSSGSFAAVGDDPGLRATRPDAGTSGRLSEGDVPMHETPDQAPAPATSPVRNAKHIGVDDAASDAHPANAGTDADEKPAPVNAHKAKSLRWQSLLPGVMK